MLKFIEIVFFFMQTHEKKTQLGNNVLCAEPRPPRATLV